MINDILELDLKSAFELDLIITTFSKFNKENSACLSVEGVYGHDMKVKAARIVFRALNEINGSSVTAQQAQIELLLTVKIFLRERTGSDLLMSQDASALYLKYAASSSNNYSLAIAAMPCIMNLIIHEVDAPEPVSATKKFLEVLSMARPTHLLYLVSRSLYHLCATKKSALDTLITACKCPTGSGLAILISTLAWCIRLQDPPFPLGSDRVQFGIEILKLLYLIASCGEIEIEGGTDDIGRIMTVLGQVLCESLFLSHQDSLAFQFKLHVVNLLMHMPSSYASYLAENAALEPLVCILEHQLLLCEFEKSTVDPEIVLSPILAVLASAASADNRSRSILKSFIFPSETDDAWNAYRNSIHTPKTEPEVLAEKQRRMHPADAPKESLRGRLIGCLTMLEPLSRRFAGELLWHICDGNKGNEEFMYRVGLGSGIGMLRNRGILGNLGTN